MPPAPPQAARPPRLLALATLVIPLALGFVTGVWLARSGADGPLHPRSANETAHAERATEEAEQRARLRARTRSHAERVSAGTTAPPGSVTPTRRSVQASIDAIDPRDWLAAYGTVVETPISAD